MEDICQCFSMQNQPRGEEKFFLLNILQEGPLPKSQNFKFFLNFSNCKNY